MLTPFNSGTKVWELRKGIEGYRFGLWAARAVHLGVHESLTVIGALDRTEGQLCLLIFFLTVWCSVKLWLVSWIGNNLLRPACCLILNRGFRDQKFRWVLLGLLSVYDGSFHRLFRGLLWFHFLFSCLWESLHLEKRFEYWHFWLSGSLLQKLWACFDPPLMSHDHLSVVILDSELASHDLDQLAALNSLPKFLLCFRWNPGVLPFLLFEHLIDFR